MKLSNRLLINLSLVPKGTSVADIGCDHAYCSIYLIEQDLSNKVIAMDINKGPLERAKAHIEEAGMEDRIQCRLSDGMEKLIPGEVDTAVISGLGGNLMIRILSAYPYVTDELKYLVLQPQSDIGLVRRFVQEIGFHIERELACKEGKFYFSFLCAKGKEEEKWSEEDYLYGKKLIESKDETLKEFLNDKKRTLQDIVDKLDEDNPEVSNLREKIHTIDKALIRME
ncbi:tRNA (adenine(22)-N(1))-methyltransferase [Eubacterium xylanophilum]|uniref:tRNA (adenine(22)-N(1))-methyltransferase n=1 Tax=Eubacterium xylanophilum TaxID=39497 RepID=UPI00047C4F4B|nr:class I SAM-dependent methyltransferase [Eubacterium xylanophilum]